MRSGQMISMKFHLLIAAVLAPASSMAYGQSQPVQWRVQDGGNGHWYQVRVESAGILWETAQAAAASLGGQLTSLETAAERQFCFDTFNRVAFPAAWAYQGSLLIFGPWIGGYQLAGSAEPNQGWRWLSGPQFDPERPPGCCNNACQGSSNEDRLQLYHSISTDETTWNDLPSLVTCGQQVVGYIIEWSADCNGDEIVDYGQILSGQLPDRDSNGVPDTCEARACPGDITGNGNVNGVDLSAVLTSWGTNGQSEFGADINGDGTVDGLDLTVVLAGWGPCPSSLAWATVIEFQPDPSVVTDANLRAAITSTGLPWRVRDNASQIEMLLVPSGSYMRGCSPGDPHCQSWESPRHQVTLTAPFYLGRYEVTQAQWLAIAGFNPSQYQHFPDSPLLPVERVSPPMIGQSFLAVTGLRLPTDAEWEYACRAGTTTAYFNGSNDMFSVDPIMWNLGNSGNRPWPVGTKAANALGLHDMLGNIWEWCSDIYSAYGPEPLVDPTGPAGPPTADRVLRGGSFGDLWFVAYRSSYRNGYPYTQQEGGVGFRVARDP